AEPGGRLPAAHRGPCRTRPSDKEHEMSITPRRRDLTVHSARLGAHLRHRLPSSLAPSSLAPQSRRHRAPRLAHLLWHQVRYEQLSFWRNPQSAFFTFVFPVVIIVIFGAMFGGDGPSSYFYGRSPLQYYVPTIAAVSVLGSCYSQLAIVLAMRRQDGILKRVR